MQNRSILLHSMFAAVVFLMASSCVQVSESVLVYDLPPVPMENVMVYFDNDEIPEHTRVAILSGKGNSSMTSRGRMLDELRERAGALGANAIIISQVEEPSGTEVLANALATGIAGGARRHDAIAIFVEE